MKRIIPMLFGSILLFSCISAVLKTGNYISSDIPLMPFYRNYRFGYINSETFEIVITEQYKRAGNFNSEYAVVEKRYGKPFIINKNNKKILGGFDKVVLFNTEDNKMTFALTGTYGNYQVLRADGVEFSLGFWYTRPNRITYRFYNLTTGKLVAKMGKREQTDFERMNLKIYFFNNYFIWIYDDYYNKDYDEAVYEIQNDGSIKKCSMTVKEFISQIVLDYELQNNKRDYNYSIGKYYSWIEYFNPLDIDKLLDQVPDNMKIKVDKYNWHYTNNKPFLNIKLIDNITHPLKDKFLYEVELIGNSDGRQYIGIYNASENIWVIPPIKKETFRHFYFIEGKDWIAYGEGSNTMRYSFFYADFFNIKTRKKYKYQYFLYNYSMIYNGYDESPHEKAKEPIVEDF
jgi:hypothetical protein